MVICELSTQLLRKCRHTVHFKITNPKHSLAAWPCEQSKAYLVESNMHVELFDEAADGDACVLGGRREVDVGVRQPDELGHVRHAAQLVAQVVEHPRLLKLLNCLKHRRKEQTCVHG